MFEKIKLFAKNNKGNLVGFGGSCIIGVIISFMMDINYKEGYWKGVNTLIEAAKEASNETK